FTKGEASAATLDASTVRHRALHPPHRGGLHGNVGAHRARRATAKFCRHAILGSGMTPVAKGQRTDPLASSRGASLFAQAIAFHQAGILNEAEQRYRQILSMDPTHFDCLHMTGVIDYQRGEHAKALSQIDLALRINPRSAAAHNNRGVVLME